MKDGPEVFPQETSGASTAASRPARFTDSRFQKTAGIRCRRIIAGDAASVSRRNGHNCARLPMTGLQILWASKVNWRAEPESRSY